MIRWQDHYISVQTFLHCLKLSWAAFENEHTKCQVHAQAVYKLVHWYLLCKVLFQQVYALSVNLRGTLHSTLEGVQTSEESVTMKEEIRVQTIFSTMLWRVEGLLVTVRLSCIDRDKGKKIRSCQVHKGQGCHCFSYFIRSNGSDFGGYGIPTMVPLFLMDSSGSKGSLSSWVPMVPQVPWAPRVRSYPWFPRCSRFLRLPWFFGFAWFHKMPVVSQTPIVQWCGGTTIQLW